MTKKELRIATAKDILDNLKVYKIKTGSFVTGTKITEKSRKVLKDNITDSKVVAEKLKKECYVCGLGACFLSLVKIDNKFQFEHDLINLDKEEDSFYNSKEIWVEEMSLFERLQEIFAPEQIMMIECAFELGKGYFNPWVHEAYRGGDQTDHYYVDNIDNLSEFEALGSPVTDSDKKKIKNLYLKAMEAVEFGKKFKKPVDRLEAIMKNLIKNGGIFKP